MERAQAAQRSGAFADEIVPVTVATRKGKVVVDSDEQPGKSDVAKILTLKPAFKKDGSVTAASSSSISDGAAITVLMSADDARRRGVTPLARIVGHVTHSQEPEWFTTAPVAAIQSLVGKIGWQLDEVDLFEINEAFAVVAMTPIKQLGIAHDKVNVHGAPVHWVIRSVHRARACGDIGERVAQPRRHARNRDAVHRWRRSDCHRHRIDLIIFNGDFAKLNARALDTRLMAVIMSGRATARCLI